MSENKKIKTADLEKYKKILYEVKEAKEMSRLGQSMMWLHLSYFLLPSIQPQYEYNSSVSTNQVINLIIHSWHVLFLDLSASLSTWPTLFTLPLFITTRFFTLFGIRHTFYCFFFNLLELLHVAVCLMISEIILFG